ncbi:Mbeg1-like protein [Natronospira bacteriovora]|uniref:Mbeg1-like protein n=1 Tax=Natronospira bacteriovora TaxID=3069753 RepID=UPI0035B54D2A
MSAAFAFAVGQAAQSGTVASVSSEAVTDARLSRCVADSSCTGADGYELARRYENDTGLRAALFVNEEGSAVLAFRGTRFFSIRDWIANFRQAFGLASSQYESAILTARQLHRDYGGNIRFTGHSLGGGLAAAAAIHTDASARVFNAAGLHDNTLGDFSSERGSVTHYYSSTDALRAGNALTPASVPGTQRSLGPAGLHGMRGVCRAMGC